jgi:hypothetical protein
MVQAYGVLYTENKDRTEKEKPLSQYKYRSAVMNFKNFQITTSVCAVAHTLLVPLEL